MESLYKVMICHMLGDYTLQKEYLADTKGSNPWHMIIHCFLYTLPYYLFFGFDWRLLLLLVSHFIVDTAKAKYNKINYVQDQIIHLLFAVVYLVEV